MVQTKCESSKSSHFQFLKYRSLRTKHITNGSLNLFHLAKCDIYNEDKMVRNA